MNAMRGLAIGTVLAIESARAGTPPPKIVALDSIGQFTTTVKPATAVTLGSVRIQLESGTFADVENIEAVPIGQEGDASEFLMWACFTLSKESQRLWLTSSELGGRKFIDGVAAQVLPRGSKASSDCPELPDRFKPVHLDRGIWLGVDLDTLKRLFGEPAVKPGGVFSFSYVGKDREYDVVSTLIVRLKNGRVKRLHASHTTTN